MNGKEFVKKNWAKKVLAVSLSGAMLVNMTAVSAQASSAEEEAGPGTGKYVKEVFLAYGETEAEAKQWLVDNGWEPLKGDVTDLNAGKNSSFDDPTAVVMGIRRTDNTLEAITDMAVMNMKGGYEFPDYEKLVDDKRAEIDEYINLFMPVIEEFRANYNGDGSEAGRQRAQLAYEMLNKFYDGGPEEQYAANDTGMLLGDLFLTPLKQEGNESGGDLQQILLESPGAGTFAVKTCLAMAADAGQESWLDRLSEMGGDAFAEHPEDYLPEAAGQDLAPSAVEQLLKQYFGDTADILANEWTAVHDSMIWYETYNDEHDLWLFDNESEEENNARITEYFKELEKTDSAAYDEEHDEYFRTSVLYEGLYETPYESQWGETLADFFNPSDSVNIGADVSNFYPLAAALSEGQRRAANLVNLSTLIMLGWQNDTATLNELFPSVDELMEDTESISIYSGMDRGIFRGGVALTSEALMEKAAGYDPYNDLWSISGVYNISCYCAAIVSIPLMAAGITLWAVFGKASTRITQEIATLQYKMAPSIKQFTFYRDLIGSTVNGFLEQGAVQTFSEVEQTWFKQAQWQYDWAMKYQNQIEQLEPKLARSKTLSSLGRTITCIGGAILLAAAFAKGYQLYRYYQKDFTQIPRMIVDESDIVTYTTDENGKEIKNIEFDQYVYYRAVKCNRQEYGDHGDWQDGVDMYEEWGCGDIADINADFGQEWLALYTVTSPKKGDPILADSLTVQFGSSKMPSGCTQNLHFFTKTFAIDLADMAYCFNDNEGSIYFFWDSDETAYASAAASSFSAGQMAIAVVIGLAAGIIGTTILLMPRRKKQEAE